MHERRAESTAESAVAENHRPWTVYLIQPNSEDSRTKPAGSRGETDSNCLGVAKCPPDMEGMVDLIGAVGFWDSDEAKMQKTREIVGRLFFASLKFWIFWGIRRLTTLSRSAHINNALLRRLAATSFDTGV